MSHDRPPQRFVLASGSPRRKELLGQLGLEFTVDPADLDEAVRAGEAPAAYVERLAREKAASVAARHPGQIVLAADTTVALDGEILGKPADEAQARAMLSRLSGRQHSVFTGVATPSSAVVVESRVRFRPLTPKEIAWYVATGEPMDKAGAYAIQGRAGAFIVALEGSPTNVIGLPLPQTLELLAGAGLALPF
jgi:septum formation protein